MLLGKLCFLFLPFFVSGLHLERRGYRDIVVKVVYMMRKKKAMAVMLTIGHNDEMIMTKLHVYVVMISAQVNKDVPEHKCQHLVASIKVKLHDIFSLFRCLLHISGLQDFEYPKMLHRFAEICVRIIVFSSGGAYLC